MIISASYKTDIPAFYADWLLARLAAGFCRMTNPWGGQICDVPLTPGAVDGFVLWTRNMGPLAGRLPAVAAVAPFAVQFTVTGYPRAIESSTIPAGRAVAQIRRLRQDFGPRAVVWRYDPVLFTSLTPAAWHRENFAALGRALAGSVDEAVVSFAHVYRKTRRNLDAAAARGGFAWEDPEPNEWHAPDFLKGYEKQAEKAALEPDARASVNLRHIPTEDPWMTPIQIWSNQAH